MCRRLFLPLLLLVGQSLAYSTHLKEREMAAEYEKQNQPDNLERQHREALTDEKTVKFKIEVKNSESFPMAKEEEEEVEGNSNAEGNTANNRQNKPNGPIHSPDELPIAIKPYRVDGTIENNVEDKNKKTLKKEEEGGAETDVKSSEEQLLGNNRSKPHRTPILNIKHDFMFPTVSTVSKESGELVIALKNGQEIDTRPLSQRTSPNPTNLERHGALSTVCGGVFTSLSGIISSPDYPFNYPSSIQCIYKIVLPEAYTVGLDCNDFSIQPGDRNCENDYLEISDNGEDNEPSSRYCGDKAITDFSHSSNMTLIFKSDASYQYRGFMCRYRALNPDGTGAEGIVNINSTASEHTIICTGPGDDGWAGKCGVSNTPSSRIVGGYVVRENQFPWMVAVLKECGKELEHYCHICGGTVIHSQWILTGAHCIVSVPVETIAMLLGDHNLYTLTPSQKFFRVEAVYIHPDFNVPSPLNNDVALAKLPQKMAFNKYIAPICMPPKNPLHLLNLLPRELSLNQSTTGSPGRELSSLLSARQIATTPVPVSHQIIHENFDGRNVSVFGWGTINDDNEISQTLRGVMVSILPNAECDYYYGVMTDTMLCTSGYGGQGPCQGDSGSPAQMQMVDGRWLQVGVLAFGAAYGCEVGYPSGNVLLPFYVDWIEFVTGFDFSEYF